MSRHLRRPVPPRRAKRSGRPARQRAAGAPERRAAAAATAAHQPLYARVLRLRHLALSGLACFVFLEGTIALGVLLALAELVPWWGVPVLPAVVALMVKINDIVAGALAASGRGRAPGARTPGARGRAAPPGQRPPGAPAPAAAPAWVLRHVSRDPAESRDPVASPDQRVRQAAHRRYR